MSKGEPGYARKDGSARGSEKRVKRAIGDITVRSLRIDTKPLDFGARAPFFRIWRAKRRGDDLPRWKSFDSEVFIC